ncbi:hypothetical protein ACUTQW_05590 [Serratia sp. TSA_7]|nr:hypothetical protein [Serratia plymuthica]CAI0775764.1 Uncharacterised protein [Serratia plymuthica]
MKSTGRVEYESFDIPIGMSPDEELLKGISYVREGLFNRQLSDDETIYKFFNHTAYRRRCILFFDQKKEVAGYLCLQSYNLSGQGINILRCQTALKKHIRGKTGIVRHILTYLFSEKRIYTQKSYAMYYMINPASYSLAMKFSKNEFWPSYGYDGNAAGIEWYRKTLSGIDRDIIEREGVFIHKSKDGYVIEKALPPKNKHVDFFLSKNPGYINGDGLVVIGKITFLIIFRYAFRFLTRKKPKK